MPSSPQQPAIREWVSINGQIVTPDKAVISVFDSGFLQGVGLFETMRSYDGVVFRLDAHLDRLAQSAQALGWAILPDREAMRENVMLVTQHLTEGDARVRLTVTTGSLRVTTGDEAPHLTFVATASLGAKYPDDIYIKGVTAVIAAGKQVAGDPTFAHKTTSYFGRLAALRAAHRVGAFEALWFTPEGKLAEGSISSGFVVEDGKLATPPLTTPVLPGVTRAAVIELAVHAGIPVREDEITMDRLLDADEVFLASSLMELVPVVRVERKPIGTEKPGDVARDLAGRYIEVVQMECGHAL